MKAHRLAAVLLTAAAALAQWSEPVNVSRIQPGTRAWHPSLTVDSAGTLHASWSLTVTDPFDWIEYACKPAGVDTWTLPVHVSRDTFPLRGSVVVIGPGHVPHIVWQSEAEPGHIYITRKDGDTWTIPERLTSWNRWGSGIKATADRAGRIHVVWHDVTFDYIWYASYDESGWHGPEPVAYDTTPWALFLPDVAADRNGRPHTVFVRRESLAYSYRSDTGWSEPSLVPTLLDRPRWHRVTLDTLDRLHVVSLEYDYQVSHSFWTGDSWSTPVRLDSVEGYDPSVCCDSWNQVHVFFGDEGIGMREKVWWRNRWQQALLVDTHPGWSEPMAERNKLHLLWTKSRGAANYWSVWYSWRPLEPPAVGDRLDGPQLEVTLLCQNPVTPNSAIVVTAVAQGPVVLSVLDATGRVVRRPESIVARPDGMRIRPYGLLPRAGVYFVQIEAKQMAKIVKVVRVN